MDWRFEGDGRRPAGIGTIAVWGGEDSYLLQGATQVPVVQSVSYGYRDIDEWYDVALGRREGHIYSRNTNPTVAALERKIRHLEGAEACTSFATGMAAVSAALFALLSPGDRVVTITDTYGGTSRLFLEFLPRFQIDVAMCDTADHAAVEAEIARGCDLIYLESPTNPTLKILDLRRLSALAHEHGAVVVVDNTFATPVNQQPLSLGADLVLHSATKFLGGHGDALGGVACGSAELVAQLFHYREITGATLHPEAAYLILRGVKTLHLRVRHQNASALRVAEFLAQRDEVEDVFYPGLKDHPGHEVAARQMEGFGGVLSFSLHGGFDSVRSFLPKLHFAHLAASLGAVETLAGPPRTTSHVELTEEQRRSLGIPEGLIRYSVGVEETDDIIADLASALDGLAHARLDGTARPLPQEAPAAS